MTGPTPRRPPSCAAAPKRRAARGRVLIIESLGTSGADPATFAEMNLRMLVLTGGRERTIDDYSALAAAAGLQVTAVHDIPERYVIIECAAADVRSFLNWSFRA